MCHPITLSGKGIDFVASEFDLGIWRVLDKLNKREAADAYSRFKHFTETGLVLTALESSSR